MYILGISCYYHDSSATLLKDGQVVFASEEERHTRIKHDNSFPINAINAALNFENITGKNIDYVVFYEKPLLKFERILHEHVKQFPKSLKVFLKSMPVWITQKLRIQKTIRKKLEYNKEILFIPHHLSHAAGAFLPSPFKSAAILTVDGVGEYNSTTLGKGNKNKIDILKEINFPHSIGLFYSTITAYLGFSVNNSEFKIMGLASYGEKNKKKNKHYHKLKKIININQDGSFSLDMTYFKFQYSDHMPAKKLCNLLGSPIKKPNDPLKKKHKDIASALQMITEEILIKILNHLHKITNETNLVMSGGVALNSVFNGKILKSTKFKKIWIQPASSDSGNSLGATYYVWNSYLKNKKRFSLKNVYLGLIYSDKNIKEFLEKNNIIYKKFKNSKEKVKTTAKLIFENKVIGWFQGRMEFGPRALGSRSILANPTNIDMQEILNKKVKHRENFRPFAPVVCTQDAKKFFEVDNPTPLATDFMLMVYPIKKKWQKLLPSITHVDGSGRLQTISKKQNTEYYNLIKEFEKLSGVPILINTSFNIRGEPIVESPKDAYRCMMGTNIDYLILGNYIIKRSDNLKDNWDSSIDAID